MKWTARLLFGLLTGAALSACASNQDRDVAGDWYGSGRHDRDYDYRGRDHGYGFPAGVTHFRGEGAAALDPWLGNTPEGREIVRRGFRARNGWLTLETAHRANIWFRRYADTNDDLALTDSEIRVALVQAARASEDARY